MFELTSWPRSAWSIFDDLESLQESMNPSTTERHGDRERRPDYRYPPMNVWSSPEGLVIDAELPGVDPEAVEINVVGDELTLSGMINDAERKEGETLHRRERPCGKFSRSLQLPFRAAAEAVKAGYQDGILRISVPRSEEEKPKRIKIEAA